MVQDEKRPQKKKAPEKARAKRRDVKAGAVEAPLPTTSGEVAGVASKRPKGEKPVKAAGKDRLAKQARNQAEREARRAENQALRKSGKAKPDKAAAGDAAKPARKAVAATNKRPAKVADRKAERDAAVITPQEVGQPAAPAVPTPPFNILVIAQEGRLAREAAVFAASLRQNSPDWKGRLIVAEPRAEGAWQGRTTLIQTPAREILTKMGAEITPFTARHFGHSYPYGNKIEALAVLPAEQPFLFFDSDTLVTGELDRISFDFSRPSASMQREGSWPKPPLYGPDFDQIWGSLYDRVGLDFPSSLDLAQPEGHWERYLYFNAGWFYGADPVEYGQRFLAYALAIRDEPGEALAAQSLDPWLDQVVLPLVIHGLGGGRPDAALSGLDGDATCHYRNLSLLYARGSDKALATYEAIAAIPEIAALMQEDEGFQKLLVGGQGRGLARPMFGGGVLPLPEKMIRQRLKREGLWFGR